MWVMKIGYTELSFKRNDKKKVTTQKFECCESHLHKFDEIIFTPKSFEVFGFGEIILAILPLVKQQVRYDLFLHWMRMELNQQRMPTRSTKPEVQSCIFAPTEPTFQLLIENVHRSKQMCLDLVHLHLY